LGSKQAYLISKDKKHTALSFEERPASVLFSESGAAAGLARSRPLEKKTRAAACLLLAVLVVVLLQMPCVM
jgi:hypothetical protein